MLSTRLMYQAPDRIGCTGYSQLCAGQEAGCEIAIHLMREVFEEDETQGLIQVDATNAFNSINRNSLLSNVEVLCPEISTYVKNSYGKPARLFVHGGEKILSKEGTTQGDLVATGMYAIGLMPLLSVIATQDITHVAFVDDLTGAGEISILKVWWDKILLYGPHLGYNVNESKSWLLTKEQYLEDSKKIFEKSKINITVDGRCHLGAVIGSLDNKAQYVRSNVIKWIKELETLTKIAKFQPHAAYAALVHGLRHKFTFIMRTVPNISMLLQPLNEAINNFIHVLFQGHRFAPNERLLLSLPPRFGGMGILIPSDLSDQEYQNSTALVERMSTE